MPHEYEQLHIHFGRGGGVCVGLEAGGGAVHWPENEHNWQVVSIGNGCREQGGGGAGPGRKGRNAIVCCLG